MRIDEKEEFIQELCTKLGLDFTYSWSKYWVTTIIGNDPLSGYSAGISFTREELEEWGTDNIEFRILSLYIEISFEG